MQATLEPRHQSNRRSKKARRRAAKIPSAPRILFVDDDLDIQTTFEMRMRPYAVEIEHAYFGTQGIVSAVEQTPDLVLMDLAMPNGNGEYLLETIRRNPSTCRAPVIVLTGMRDPELRRRVLQKGADVFLHKPARFDDLLHEIGRFIDLRPLNAEC